MYRLIQYETCSSLRYMYRKQYLNENNLINNKTAKSNYKNVMAERP